MPRYGVAVVPVRSLGTGHTRVTKLLRVKIPPNTLGGIVLRGTGLGGKSNDGGPPGDLLCKVAIRANRIFSVNGLDLARELKIDFVLASLGGKTYDYMLSQAGSRRDSTSDI